MIARYNYSWAFGECFEAISLNLHKNLMNNNPTRGEKQHRRKLWTKRYRVMREELSIMQSASIYAFYTWVKVY